MDGRIIVFGLRRERGIAMIKRDGKKKRNDRLGRRRATIRESEEKKGKENEGLRPRCETDLNDR